METRNSADDRARRRDFILVSALFHARPPGERVHANCERVLRHGLIAAGLWEDEFEEGASGAFQGMEEDLARFPVIGLWYSTLIQLILREPESERLLEGAGNFVTPAGAAFTACWLTPAGRAEAERLLAEHPEWEVRMRQ